MSLLEVIEQQPDPIFTIDKVQFQFPRTITACTVSNNILGVGLADLKLLRIDLTKADKIDEIIIPGKQTDRISQLHSSPSRWIVSSSSNDHFLLHATSLKPQLITKLKVFLSNTGIGYFMHFLVR
jgi:hypothetical protein